MSDEPSSFRERFDEIWPEQAPAATGTPRTDANLIRSNGMIMDLHGYGEIVRAKDARALETDLAAANAQLQQITKERDEARAAKINLVNERNESIEQCQRLRLRIAELEKERDAQRISNLSAERPVAETAAANANARGSDDGLSPSTETFSQIVEAALSKAIAERDRYRARLKAVESLAMEYDKASCSWMVSTQFVLAAARAQEPTT